MRPSSTGVNDPLQEGLRPFFERFSAYSHDLESMQIHLERPNAARLYQVIGQDLWLHGIASSALTDAEKLEALKRWNETIKEEIGVRRLSQMQNEVYCALAVKDQHIQEQTAALRAT